MIVYMYDGYDLYEGDEPMIYQCRGRSPFPFMSSCSKNAVLSDRASRHPADGRLLVRVCCAAAFDLIESASHLDAAACGCALATRSGMVIRS